MTQTGFVEAHISKKVGDILVTQPIFHQLEKFKLVQSTFVNDNDNNVKIVYNNPF